MTNIILCGGVGSRLWPLSRTHFPKQFARILKQGSLFEETVRRNRALGAKILIAANREQFGLAVGQLSRLEVDEYDAMIEPEGRNTAPAIALSCLMLDPDEIVLVTPSDHLISGLDEYARAVARAQILAAEGHLVTFGIEPSYPETGFGYIEAEGEVVRSFKEKPDESTAAGYIASGRYFWNSGMFCFRAGAFLAELEALHPEMHRACVLAYERAENRRPLQASLSDMRSISAQSIDYAVMEKSSIVSCVPCASSIGWSDVGSFDALYEHFTDGGPNAVNAEIEPILIGSSRNLVIDSSRQVALVDVEDLLIIESPDALLVARRGSSQKVKQVFDELKARKSTLVDTFPRIERRWGNFIDLHESDGYRVRKMEVYPGQRQSLQRHKLREEHWIVLKGEATLQVDGSRRRLGPGQSMFVPKGAAHRLENAGNESCVVIETQIGIHIGDDDEERIPDEDAS